MLSVQKVVAKAVSDAAFSLAVHVSSELWMRVDSLPLSLTPMQRSKNECLSIYSVILKERN